MDGIIHNSARGDRGDLEEDPLATGKALLVGAIRSSHEIRIRQHARDIVSCAYVNANIDPR